MRKSDRMRPTPGGNWEPDGINEDSRIWLAGDERLNGELSPKIKESRWPHRGCVSLPSQDLSELRTSCFLRAGCLATIPVVDDVTLLGGDMTGGLEECVFVCQLDQENIGGDVPLPQNGYSQENNTLRFYNRGEVCIDIVSRISPSRDELFLIRSLRGRTVRK